MDKDTKLINHLLLGAADSSEALAGLNRLQKSRSDHWSMQYVCKKVGIPSTGYFSDVLKGKRRLHPKYIGGIQSVFGLPALQARYLELLILRDQTSVAAELSDLNEKLMEVSTMMEVQFVPIPQQLSQGLLFHILVLSAFSLFKEAPLLKDLEAFFGRALSIPLGKSLHKLQSMGLIEMRDGRYTLSHTRIIFQESEDGFSHLDFLEKAIIDSASQVKYWFPKADRSLFLSTIVTVKQKDYERLLPEIRKRLMSILADLDCAPGDQLIKFNMQLFPFDPQAVEL